MVFVGNPVAKINQTKTRQVSYLTIEVGNSDSIGIFFKFFKGEIHKKAYELIWLRFFFFGFFGGFLSFF